MPSKHNKINLVSWLLKCDTLFIEAESQTKQFDECKQNDFETDIVLIDLFIIFSLMPISFIETISNITLVVFVMDFLL